MAAAVSSGPTAATAIGTPAAGSGGAAPPPQPPTEYLNEVPSSLKQLARIVVRGFYGVEDALIIDMLVRYIYHSSSLDLDFSIQPKKIIRITLYVWI